MSDRAKWSTLEPLQTSAAGAGPQVEREAQGLKRTTEALEGRVPRRGRARVLAARDRAQPGAPRRPARPQPRGRPPLSLVAQAGRSAAAGGVGASCDKAPHSSELV